MFRFAMLQHLNRVVLQLHDKFDFSHARVRACPLNTFLRTLWASASNSMQFEWSLLAQIRRGKSAIFHETKLQLLKPHLGGAPSNEVPKIRITRRSTTTPAAASAASMDTTIFMQAFKQMHAMPAAALYNLQRAFQVEFQGEGATDAGGPYREVLTNMCTELQSKALALLIPTPNARESVGTNTDQWMPNPSQASAAALQHYTFLGRLMGIAARNGSPLALDLSPVLWKELVGEKLALTDLALVDARSAELLKRISRGELVEEVRHFHSHAYRAAHRRATGRARDVLRNTPL